jgi:hypothetical protein
VDGVESGNVAKEVDGLARGGGAPVPSTTLSACNTASLSAIMSLGISASGKVGPNAFGAALFAFAGAKGTKAGL